MSENAKEAAKVRESDRLSTNESFKYHFEQTVEAFREATGIQDVSQHTDAISRMVASRLQHEQQLVVSRVMLHVPELTYQAAFSNSMQEAMNGLDTIFGEGFPGFPGADERQDQPAPTETVNN